MPVPFAITLVVCVCVLCCVGVVRGSSLSDVLGVFRDSRGVEDTFLSAVGTVHAEYADFVVREIPNPIFATGTYNPVTHQGWFNNIGGSSWNFTYDPTQRILIGPITTWPKIRDETTPQPSTPNPTPTPTPTPPVSTFWDILGVWSGSGIEITMIPGPGADMGTGNFVVVWSNGRPNGGGYYNPGRRDGSLAFPDDNLNYDFTYDSIYNRISITSGISSRGTWSKIRDSGPRPTATPPPTLPSLRDLLGVYLDDSSVQLSFVAGPVADSNNFVVVWSNGRPNGGGYYNPNSRGGSLNLPDDNRILVLTSSAISRRLSITSGISNVGTWRKLRDPEPATPTPTPTGTPTPTPTGAPPPTVAPTPTPTGAPTPTPTPAPTRATTEAPTSTAVPTGQPCSATSSTDCGSGSYCDEVSFKSRCQLSLSLGSVCPNLFFPSNKAHVCGPNGYCQVTNSLDSTGICVSRGTSGSTCQPNNELACVQGMVCLRTTNICSTPLPQGSTCSWNTDCASGICGPTSTCSTSIPSGFPSGLPTLPNMPTKVPGSTINTTCSPTSLFEQCDPITYCNEDSFVCDLSIGVGGLCKAFFTGTKSKVCGSTSFCKKANKLDSVGICTARATNGQSCDINDQASCMGASLCTNDFITGKGPTCIDTNTNTPVPAGTARAATVGGVWCLVVLLVGITGMI